MHKRGFKLILVLALMSLVLGSSVMPVLGHDKEYKRGGYDYDQIKEIENPDWMASLPDDLRISELSIPGTHETMARCKDALTCGTEFVKWWVKCQSYTLDAQLLIGIRAFDIRCRHFEDSFAIHHGVYHVDNMWFDTDVLEPVIDFLKQHPTETVLMRIKPEHDPAGNEKTFAEVLVDYINDTGAPVWQPPEGIAQPNPTLGEVRGKIVILDGFSGGNKYGINWFDDSYVHIQDIFKLKQGHDDMDNKWYLILDHLEEADTGSMDDIYINFLSGVGDGPDGAPGDRTVYPHPWFFAGGHNSYTRHLWPYFDPGTDGTHMTWWGQPADQCGPFPIHNGACILTGMNELILEQWINDDTVTKQTGRMGIIMADFPSDLLADAIIDLNWTGVADANGPYEGDEGSEIVFDASASFDPDGDALQYRWDFNNDGSWDTDWSDNPTVGFTWYDDYTGAAQLEVTDGYPTHVATDMAAVTVNNVAPMTTIDSISSPVEGCILPGQEVGFVGSFTDPGCLDTHTAQWDFGDGSIVPGTLTEENDKPDATGSVLDGHTYGEPGIFTVLLEILDDDGGIGTANIEVKVMTASEAVDLADSFIQDLPESCFTGQADNRKKAFSNKFKAVKNALGAGGIRGAINKLMNDIRAKADGSVDGKSSNDWITDGDAQEELCLVIDELVKYLESL